MSQPHIHEAGMFDPAVAFGQTVHALINLVEGITQTPDALPVEEVLRAAQVALETMEVVHSLTAASLTARLAEVLPDEAVSEHRLMQQAQEELRTEEEREEHRVDILRRIATFFPYEDAMSDPTDD